MTSPYDNAVNQVISQRLSLPKHCRMLQSSRHASDELPEMISSMPGGVFRRAVDVAKEYIRAGDIFQVVLSQRFDVQLDADPFDVYRVLRQVNPSPYMYFVKHPDITIVGSSPEPMVQLLNGKVVSRPIAGTRKRGRDDGHDRRLASELRENPKEVAEHIMLVDLARNDVGRVAAYGSMNVDELMTLERYSHVMHLTSQVSGVLREGLGPIDVLRPHFGGDMSGHQRCGRWKLSMNLNQSSADHTPVSSDMSISAKSRHGHRYSDNVCWT